MIYRKYFKTFLKITIILISLGIFYKYLFINIAKQYSEQLTSMATEDKPFSEDETGFKIPALTLCAQPSQKASVWEKYNISEAFLNLLPGSYEYLVGKVTFEEMVNEVNFKLGVDFNLYFTAFESILINSDGIGEPLKFGNNTKILKYR